ncbi:putative ascorbate-dependent peroxidase [Trypanosoma grayi]|uniref:putative ascorbate-dependent peroxidase n=1 Tax=Trypanosoma grayi TaxID=71804 RepID=UPI0004F482CF|nr:putative ascorbate-dependent peroxidase [Trypanosoma grayi]KEG15022.1 putative ascorbate-dependent peroxidase [Trypanosoma grayi]
MFRLQTLRLGCAGPFRATGARLLWWGYKEQDLHRLARQRPWWENAAIFAGLLCFIQVTSICYYFGNRWYQALRPSGNNIYLNSAMDTKVFSRPDLSVAMVRMVIHHALSGAQTPFGAPMVYPEYLRPEAEELMEFILQLHREQPMFTIPDLWAMLSAKALARLGGPSITVRRGRPHPPSDLAEDQLLVVTPSLVPEKKRDVLSMKRLLAGQGFSVEEIAGIIGGIRNIGFHESFGFHTKAEVKPQMRRHPSLMGPEEDIFHLPETLEKCTLDPYVFGGEYFDLLLDYNWKQGGFLNRRSGLFRCDEKDRKREVTLLDPFSEQALMKERKRLLAQEKAREAVERASQKREKLDDAEEESVTGRVGEAQYIPGVDDNDDAGDDAGDMGVMLEVPEFKSPCSNVSMREIDMLLLDDALLTGWLHRFSANEIQFYNVFGNVMEKIQSRGYNLNSLYTPT